MSAINNLPIVEQRVGRLEPAADRSVATGKERKFQPVS
jgi:hypothetical protein